MKRCYLTSVFILSVSISFSQITSNDTAAIKSIIKKQEECWNKHDMIAYSQYYTTDASLINFVGMYWKSKKDIMDHFKILNECCFIATSIKFDLINLRNIAPGIVMAYIEETIVADRDYDVPGHHYKKGETEYKLLTNLFVKSQGSWKITAAQLTLIDQLASPHTRASAAPPGSAR